MTILRPLILTFSMLLPLAAASIVDQTNAPAGMTSGFAISVFSPGSNGATGQIGAQVFTAGLTGKLTEVDLPVWDYSNQPGTFSLQIWNVTGVGGTPVEPPTTALASASVNVATIPTTAPSGTTPSAWTVFTLAASNFFVTAGQSYAIVLSAHPAIGQTYLEGGWEALFSANPYAGGAGYLRGANASNTPNYTTWQSSIPGFTQWDYGFRTEVDTAATATPEPATFALSGLVLVGIGLLRRKSLR